MDNSENRQTMTVTAVAEPRRDSDNDAPRDHDEDGLPGDAEHLRMLEALLFAAEEPLDHASIAKRLPDGADVGALIEDLRTIYQHRGINLTRVAGKWAFRTAPDLHFLLQEHRQESRKLSRAALETLAIIAYHQPITRAEIEDVRGVNISKGTLDLLIETGWVRPRGRRRVPGRPITYGITDRFLEHFALESIQDLPGLGELRAAGLLEGEVRTDLLPLSAQAGEDPLGGGGEPEDRRTGRTGTGPARRKLNGPTPARLCHQLCLPYPAFHSSFRRFRVARVNPAPG